MPTPKKRTFLQYIEEKEKPVKKVLHTPIRHYLNRRNSAILSAIGGGLVSTNIPYVREAGQLIQIPDDAWDLYDFAKSGFNKKEAVELIPDLATHIPQIAGTPLDDKIRLGGMINDASYGITGKSLIDYGNSFKSQLNTRTRKLRHRLSNSGNKD